MVLPVLEHTVVAHADQRMVSIKGLFMTLTFISTCWKRSLFGRRLMLAVKGNHRIVFEP
jgi:hypothetical protein